jgi:2-oxoglutarate ferredoxin oxidoreductase subunit beta
LTKGQFSPTTPTGFKTKSSPQGTVEHPFNVGELAIGAQGTFFARAVDTNPKMMTEIMLEASRHHGTSLLEIMQNCVIFNDKIHAEFTARDTRDDNQIYLKHGEPMIFGAEKNKGLVLEKGRLKAVTIGENGYTMDDILVHDVKEADDTIHYMLARMSLPELPVAMGVIRSYETTVYESLLESQIEAAKEQSKIKSVNDLLHSGNTFEVE